MADKAKHAYGSRKELESAIANKVVDAYDVLFLKGEGETPAIGWVDKFGNPVVISPADDLAELETQLETELATKASIEKVDAVESQIATKADAEEVNAKLEQTELSAKSYTDGKIEAAINEHLVKKYEISHKPNGTIVDYRDKEIRILCPVDTQWEFQQSGAGANPNSYYIGFKAYAQSDDIVSFKEDLGEIITDETMYYFENNDFAGIDKYGRKYSIVWLPVAVNENGVWKYHGTKSSSDKFIGWYYSVEWYNADGVLIASDCIRINLSNEECHSVIKPFYVNDVVSAVKAYTDTKIEEKLSEVESSYEIVEF